MQFTRVGHPEKLGAPGKWDGKAVWHKPPFDGGIYAYIPGFENVFLCCGLDAVKKSGFFSFDFQGAVYCHDLVNGGWVRFESVEGIDFIEYVIENFKKGTYEDERGYVFHYSDNHHEVYLDNRGDHSLTDITEIPYDDKKMRKIFDVHD